MSKFDQKVQKEVSQMANRKLSCAMLYRWFKCKLKPPKNEHPGVNTMSRRQYYEDVLCAIGIGQSTSVDDDFPPFILE